MAQKRASKFRYFCVAALLVVICYGLVTFRLPFWVAALYFGMGTLSFTLYALSRSEKKGRSRGVRDTHLMLVDLAFGIFGGLLGQQVFSQRARSPLFVFAALGLTAFHMLVVLAVIEITPGPIRSLN